MESTLKKLSCVTLAAILPLHASADIHWNGFATIAGGKTTSSDEVLIGYDNDFSFDAGSLFGLQASSSLGDGLSVTAQIIARGDDDWDPDFEWAYISYDMNDELRFLVGRQRTPFYMFSDFLDVSYALPWISAPDGVYGSSISSIDGISAIYTTNVSAFDITSQFIFGNNDNGVYQDDIEFSVNNVAGLSVSASNDWLTLRAGYFVSNDFNVPYQPIQPLIDGWKQAGFADVADDIEVLEDDTSFATVGFQINYNDFLVISEFAQLKMEDNFAADIDSYYVMFGKSIGEFLAHVTYGSNDGDPASIAQHIPYGADPGLDGLKALTDGLTESQDVKYDYYTVGLRWNFHASAALKVEYTDKSDDLTDFDDASLVRAAVVTVF